MQLAHCRFCSNFHTAAAGAPTVAAAGRAATVAVAAGAATVAATAVAAALLAAAPGGIKTHISFSSMLLQEPTQ